MRRALDGLVASYASDPPAATFRVIVSPLVAWIWLGAAIAVAGGLICLWPGGTRARRVATAARAARVARDVREPAHV